MVEESETPGIGASAEGRGRGGEGDLLAERRARRAAESGEAALTRRAEAAEATVQTLERHVASLQQRLREAEEDQRRMAGLIEAEKVAAEEREAELRRVKQREYAEQQLRVEAEDRLVGTERDGRDELRRLGERLDADERETRELTARLEELQRQLAEAEQAAASERAVLARTESQLQGRLTELERRTEEISKGLASERQARERAEQELLAIRDGHSRMEGTLGEVKGIVGRLAGAMRSTPTRPAIPSPATIAPVLPAPPASGEQRGAEMAEALAAAVERLRARAESVSPEMLAQQVSEAPDTLPADPGAGLAEAEVALAQPDVERRTGPGPGTPPAPIPPAVDSSAVAPEDNAAPPPPAVTEPLVSQPEAKPHKHTMTLVGRIRYRRKQRRNR